MTLRAAVADGIRCDQAYHWSTSGSVRFPRCRTIECWTFGRSGRSRHAEVPIARYYIQPGEPAQNAFIERFNRTYREEVLDAVLWVSTQDVQQLSDAWLVTDNEHRPHDALGRVPQLTYLARGTTRSESNYAWST